LLLLVLIILIEGWDRDQRSEKRRTKNEEQSDRRQIAEQ
jgi:hypothetical protein